jgi:hypothetical protein
MLPVVQLVSARRVTHPLRDIVDMTHAPEWMRRARSR